MSFARILRSSALMGGAQVVTLATTFIRAKVIALLLGPAGIGVFGVLSAFNANLSALGGWGIGISGVKTIAAATDKDRGSKIAAVKFLGGWLAAGSLLLVMLLAWPAARMTFGDESHLWSLVIAGLAVPLIVLTAVFSAVLQAEGEIKQLAGIQSLGALAGLIAGMPLIWAYGETGIACSILLAAGIPSYLTWVKARSRTALAGAEKKSEDVRGLIILGGALMATSLLTQGSAYLARLLIIRHSGLEAAGHFHAANAIAMSLPGIVLVSMGTDFFPRVASAKSETEARQHAETQIRSVLVLSLPLVCALLTLGNLCVRIAYDDGFEQAAALMPWMMWGVFFRLISWPLGYWLLARGSAKLMIGVEASSSLLAGLLPALLLPSYGLTGAAAAFLLSCAAYCLILFVAVRLRSGGWLGMGTIIWCLTAAGVLSLAQFSVAGLAGPFWGLVPTVLIAGACAYISYRMLQPTNTTSIDA